MAVGYQASTCGWSWTNRGNPSAIAFSEGTCSNPSSGTKGLRFAPPYEAGMSPTGTWSFSWRSRAKKYAAAEKPFQPTRSMFAGVHGRQTPSFFSRSSWTGWRPPLTRGFGLYAAPISGRSDLGSYEKPCATLNKPDRGMIGGGDDLLAVGLHANSPLHVGLAGAEPHLTDQDVVESDVVPADGGQLVGTTRRQSGKPDLPFPIRSGDGRGVIARKADGDVLPRLGPAPDGQRHVALKDHVAAEDAGQPHVGHGRARPRLPAVPRPQGSVSSLSRRYSLALPL